MRANNEFLQNAWFHKHFSPYSQVHALLENALGLIFIPWFSKFNLGVAVGMTLLLASCHSDPTSNLLNDSELEAFRGSQKVEQILTSMTLEDKVGEMTQLTLNMLCVGDTPKVDEPHRLDAIKLERAFEQGRIGSVLNCAGHAYPPKQWREIVGEIQSVSLKAKGLPTLYGIDAIHGATYTSGAALGLQQFFGGDMGHSPGPEMERPQQREIHVVAAPWNFATCWMAATVGKVLETFGEDVKLVGDMGESMVRGLDGPVKVMPH